MSDLMISVIVLAIISQHVSTCESTGESDSPADRLAKWRANFHTLISEPDGLKQMDSYATMLYEMADYGRTKEFQDAVKLFEVEVPDPTLFQFYVLEKQFARADIGVTKVRDEGIIENLLSTFSYNSHGCFAHNFKYLNRLADYFSQPLINHIILNNIENLRDLCWYRIKDMMVHLSALVTSTCKNDIDNLLREMKLFATSKMVQNYLGIAPRFIAMLLYREHPGLKIIDGTLEQQYTEQVLEPCTNYGRIMDPAYKIFSATKATSEPSYDIIQDQEFARLIARSEFCNFILNQVTMEMINTQFEQERRENLQNVH